MVTLLKSKPADARPQTLMDDVSYAAAYEKLTRLQASAAERRRDVARLETEAGSPDGTFDRIALKARELVYGADAVAVQRQHEREQAAFQLGKERETLSILEAACDLQAAELDAAKQRALPAILATWRSTYAQLLRPLVEAISAAGRATRALVECRAEAMAEGVNLAQLEPGTLLSLAGQFPPDEQLDHMSFWLKEMNDLGLLDRAQLRSLAG